MAIATLAALAAARPALATVVPQAPHNLPQHTPAPPMTPAPLPEPLPESSTLPLPAPAIILSPAPSLVAPSPVPAAIASPTPAPAAVVTPAPQASLQPAATDAAPVAGPAKPAVPDASSAEGEELDLEALFNTQVEVATKRAQSLAEAPAVVDVVTAEDLRERGYTSVAEALRALPGFYIVDDNLMPNLGVRGLPSGLRSWSRIVKVMIDGTPVPYLPEASNFLGPELVPLGLIKRIEIIRGPASALYGADAYLGVVNIVTKRGDDMAGGSAQGVFGYRNGSGSAKGQLVAGYPAPWRDGEAIVGLAGGVDDRSNYVIPDTSPSVALRGKTTQGDISKPGTFFTRVGNMPIPYGTVSVDGGYQHVSGGGDLQDVHPLSHDTRITLENRFVHGIVRNQLGENLTTSVNVGYTRGNPGQDDRINVGDPSFLIRRDMGSDGLNAAAEGNYSFDARNSLSAGVDYSHDVHQLPTYYDDFISGDRAGQEQQVGQIGNSYIFDNVGLYSQGILYVLDETALTVGVRLDANSIYGNQFNSRVGLVSPLFGGLSGKLLYGSSFKAPAPQQLFSTPQVYGDIRGSAGLLPEKAQTVEGALTWAAGRNLELLGNVYYTHVADRIGFLQTGANPVAQNQPDVDCLGVESEAQWRWRFLHGMLNASVQTTASGPADNSAGGTNVAVPEAYPTFMANAGLGWPMGPLPLTNFLEARYVSDVPTTQQNFSVNGKNAYSLPATLLFDFTVASKEWTLGPGAISASLKLANVFDSPDAQPGFGGIDYPGVGRTLLMRVDYAF